jgi:peptidoglycan/LPS O-acetylase OafA/YrhL
VSEWLWIAAGVTVWLLLSVLFVGVAYLTVAEEDFEWYFDVGPVIGACAVVLGGGAGLFLAIRERRLRGRR